MNEKQQATAYTTKICIVGAGPAGATTSIFLGKMGIPHIIVDAAVFPRDKVCGDGLDLNTIRVLNHINPDLVKQELSNGNFFTPSAGLRFILHDGKKVDMALDTKDERIEKHKRALFYVSKRGHFDNFLVRQIDAKQTTALLGTKIETITRENKKWHIEGVRAKGPVHIEADFLIGADGDHSVVLRHLGERKIDRNNYAGAVRQYWKGVKGTHADNHIEVYFPKKLPFSYFWIFPLPNGEANVGYGMASRYIHKKKINVRKAFEELIATDPLLKHRFEGAEPLETVKGWGVPMSGRHRKAHGDGYLLVGDAASLVCPSSGEGIGSGMLSGYTAAQFLQRAEQHNDFSEAMFANYNRETHKRLRREEKMYRIANLLPGWLFSWLINSVLGSGLIQKSVMQSEMLQWVDTAYNKELVVNFD
jgi:geranylgeranyl reductase family protein